MPSLADTKMRLETLGALAVYSRLAHSVPTEVMTFILPQFAEISSPKAVVRTCAPYHGACLGQKFRMLQNALFNNIHPTLMSEAGHVHHFRWEHEPLRLYGGVYIGTGGLWGMPEGTRYRVQIMVHIGRKE